MKGKNERGEKKRKKRGGKKGKERKKKAGSTAGSEPATFHSTANCLQLPPRGRIARMNVLNRHNYIVNLDFANVNWLSEHSE